MARRRKRSSRPGKQPRDRKTEVIPERQTDNYGARPTGLRVLGKGPTFLFADLAPSNSPVDWYSVGADEDCHIVIKGDSTVSGIHCFVQCSNDKVLVRDFGSTNKTRVNAGTLEEGRMELHVGNVLMLGNSSLVVCGEQPAKTPPQITADNLYCYNKLAETYYPSLRQAGPGIGTKDRTFTRWIKKETFRIPGR